MKRLVVASNNTHKIKEIKEMLSSFDLEVKGLKDVGIDIDVEETGETFIENALIKARAIKKVVKDDLVLSDDSGLMVDALDGKPGVYSARFAGEHGNDKKNNEKLIECMKGIEEKDRGAKFVCAIALITNTGEEITIEGEVKGYITKEYEVIESKDREKLFIKTFLKERNINFKRSIKTKREFPTHILFQSIIEKLGLRKLNHKSYQELADLYNFHEEQQWIPFKNTKETLEAISNNKNLKIGVLSNHPNHNTIENVLKKYELYHFFDIVVTSAKFGMRKPDPQIFHYTMKKMGLKDPNLCLVIGDEYADIMGGNRAGLKTILYKRMIRFPFEQEIKINDYIEINDISEILDHI